MQSCHTQKKYEVTEVGVMHPDQQKTDVLFAGQVGYITCNMKNSSEGKLRRWRFATQDCLMLCYLAHIGDTLHHVGKPVKALPSFAPTKAMVNTVVDFGSVVS